MVDKYRLRAFFYALIMLDFKYKEMYSLGSATSELLKNMCMHQDHWLSRIQGDYTGDSHEFRLNGAGLKMYWKVDRQSDGFKCRIGGDQAKDYSLFVAEANQLIEMYGYKRN